MAGDVANQREVIEKFEVEMREAIGQIEFLQQKNQMLEDKLISSMEV